MASEVVKAEVKVNAADGDQVRIDFQWTVGGKPIANRGPQISLRNGRGRKGDTVKVIVVAHGDRGPSEPFEISTTVQNSPPTVGSLIIEPVGPITADSEATAYPSGGRDADGESLEYRYTWRVNGNASNVRGPTFSTDGLRRGDQIRVEVVAFDGEDEGEAMEGREIIIANGAPFITSQPGGTDDDGTFRYRVKARDPDGDTSLRYSLAEAPQGMTISRSSGSIEWRPNREQGGTHVIEVMVEDADGGKGGQRFAISVDTTDTNAQPPASQSATSSSREDSSRSNY
jgi:hypothetical protein